MPNIKDLIDADLGATANFEDWLERFELYWNDIDPEAEMLEMAKVALESMTPEEMEQVRQMDPKSFDEVVKQVNELEV